MGIRVQVFGIPFTRRKFWAAIGHGAASFPYVRANRRDPRQHQPDLDEVLEDNPDYIRRDPYQADTGEIEDPREREEWELLHGIAVEIEYHKTGKKYTMYLWFSQVEIYYLRMYETITANYCLANKRNLLPNGKINPDSAFFIDGNGNATDITCYPSEQHRVSIMEVKKS